MTKYFLNILTLVTLLTSCSIKSTPPTNLKSLAPVIDGLCPSSSTTLLETNPTAGLAVSNLGSGTTLNRNYSLLKVSRAGYRDAFVQWFPPVHQPGPVLVHLQPYYGIGWSQNSIDDQWANRPNASSGYSYPDVNGPNYDPNQSNSIHYQLMSPEQVASESSPYLINNSGVLIVYGRYYAGGSISETLQSVQLAFQFLATQSSVDRLRIGIFGFSFGGFQSLYGAALAPSEVKPKVGVAWSPLSDFESMIRYATESVPSRVTDPSTLISYNQFFDSYLRRTYASTGGPPSGAGSDFCHFKRAFLASNLTTPFLIIHNEWDTLIPVQNSKDLTSDKPSLISGYWFPQSSPADPAQVVLSHVLTEDPKYLQTASIFTQAYLLNALVNESDSNEIKLYYSSDALKSFFTYLSSKQSSGINIDLIKDRFISLTNPRIRVYDLNQKMPTLSGNELVSWAFHMYWGLNIEVNQVQTVLSGNFPASFSNSGVATLKVSETNASIVNNPNLSHLFRTCASTGCTSTDTLLVHLPGSNGLATDFSKFIQTISDKGLPAISLQYENTGSLNSLCVTSSKTVTQQNDCFIQARQDRVNGNTLSPFVSSPSDGILPRLKSALIKLHYYQFIKPDGTVDTRKIIFSGFSQGAGMAAWIGKTNSAKRI